MLLSSFGEETGPNRRPQKGARRMESPEEFALAIFKAQPFTAFLGAELKSCGPGVAEIGLPIRAELTQQHGFLHGGVLSYLADNAITFAGGLALGSNALTSEFKINYVRPAQGAYVLAKASARSTGKRQAVCQCEIVSLDASGTETLCALAQGTVVASQ
jgi:uncharacterized protein (TIGR00369 family)